MTKLSVVKIGGNVIDNPQLFQQFLRDFTALSTPKILIHGGGKIATQVAEQLRIETVMVEGRRITNAQMLDVVTMVYGGLVNKRIVAQLQALGCNALGLTGADAGVIRSEKRAVGAVDYGFVGDIVAVKAEFIQQLLQAGITPVFAPLTFDLNGNMLNTNADTQAQALATSLVQYFGVSLVYCFEKKGVLTDPDNDASVIPELNTALYATYKAEGVISKGMIPKLDNAFKALADGVEEVIICHADDVGKPNNGTRIV
jgi:acetylglutamate kinase